jgi:F-type H+-transporting ATPase subunit a
MADPAELIAHVKDAEAFYLPGGLTISIPQPFTAIGLHLTKFMVIELAVALAMLAIFIPLGRKVASGQPPRGRLWNLLEIMVLFVRDEMVRPAIGRREGDRFLPFLWSQAFFLLFLNLCGLLPWTGSPTGALGVTGAIALITFAVVVGAGMLRFGPVGFWTGQVPHMDVPWVMAIFIKPMIFGIEVLGLMIKHLILAVRLFANMFAGHLVLAVVIGFIAAAAHSVLLWAGVTVASVLGATALNLLELLVACLQAYVFTFLSALFIGMAVHQH